MGTYGNVDKMIRLGLHSWREAEAHGLTRIRTLPRQGLRLRATDGHEFINMVSCSYLGLNRHPKIVAGAIQALEQEATMSISVSRARIAPRLLDEVEGRLSDLYRCHALTAISCTAASAGVLPVLAAGHFTGGRKPVVAFDKACHFSMSVMKAAAGNETEVVICPHNDVGFLEDLCKRHSTVAYVADGAYSLGDNANVDELRSLQDRYGLFLYFDDSHSLSIHGRRGEGLVRASLDELGDRTIIVGSLAKAFGATGGVIMLGTTAQMELLDYFGGPLSWSQMANAAALGAILASAELHLTDELAHLQDRLRVNMSRIDELLPSENSGNGLPIRVFDLPDEAHAIAAAEQLYRQGFYTSAVFFPIVTQGRAGLRAMGRADLEDQDLQSFCQAMAEVTSKEFLNGPAW
jgi:7-keto-8-aminopelargonate synthetase-like enzyme